ncbi:MAG: hypothetical protein ACRCUY_04055, partial [Thermoguttaceae bacterium]
MTKNTKNISKKKSMKKQALQQKSTQKKWAAGVVGLLALGLGTSAFGALTLGNAAFGADCSSKGCQNQSAPTVLYEMVPHVVLPESIQYFPVNQNTGMYKGCLNQAGNYGVGSPYVASYTAAPSYLLPLGTEMRSVNQSVYPVTP